jgi:hypothetical protein
MPGSASTELQLVQDTEQGEFYIDAQGRAVFRNRKALLTDTRSKTSQATFGDGGFAATGEIPYADASQSTPGDTLVNTVTAARVGGIDQAGHRRRVGQARYGAKSQTRDDLLMQDDATALQWANWLKYQYSTPAPVRPHRVQQPETAGRGRVLAGTARPRLRRPDHRSSVVRPAAARRSSGTASSAASSTNPTVPSWTSAFILQGADRYFVRRSPSATPSAARVGL